MDIDALHADVDTIDARSFQGPANDLPFSGERQTVAASVARPRGGAGAARAVAASTHGERPRRRSAAATAC